MIAAYVAVAGVSFLSTTSSYSCMAVMSGWEYADMVKVCGLALAALLIARASSLSVRASMPRSRA